MEIIIAILLPLCLFLSYANFRLICAVEENLLKIILKERQSNNE
jgi:hypothetical protein